MANIAETERKAVVMADGILAAVNENGNIDRFIDTKGGVHYIEPKRYEESVAKIDAAATKAKETVNSATEAVSECKAQTGACTQETARAKEIADTVESRITGIEGDVAALRDSVSRRGKVKLTSHLNDNIVQVTFDAPIAGDYVVVITNEFVNGNNAWGWTQADSMVYDKTSVGFKIDFYAPNETYANLDVVLNWVALPV